MKHPSVTIPMAMLLLMATGCETTQLQTTWKDPTVSQLEFTKVAVLVLNSTPGQRREQEDEIVRQIEKPQAIATYTFVPDDILRDRERVKSLIQQSGSDGLVVLRLIEADKQTQYVPGSASYWGDGYGYYPMSYSPGYYTVNTYLRAEVSLYSVRHAKLLWAGSSSTVNPNGATDLARQISRAAVAELRRQKLLR